jgi:hypothetical protein
MEGSMPNASTMDEILAQKKTVEELDIPQNIAIDIILRLLYTEGYVEFRRISQVMRIPHTLEQLLEWLRKEHLVEVSQPSTSVGSINYIYKLSGSGEDRAREAMDRCQYIGPVPVPVSQYTQAIELQSTGPRPVKPAQIKEALSDLVLPSNFHRRIGPAVFIPVWSGWQWEDDHLDADRRSNQRHGADLDALCHHRGRANHPDL